MSKKLNPVNDLVVVKLIEKTKTTLSGIVIPDTASGRPDQAEVVSVGPGKKGEDGTRTPVCVKVGDIVIFDQLAGQGVKIDGVEMLVLKESDIFAVVE